MPSLLFDNGPESIQGCAGRGSPWRGLVALQLEMEVDNASDRRSQARGHDEATRQSG